MRRGGLIRFLMSSSILSCPAERLNRLLRDMMEKEIPYDSLGLEAGGDGVFRVYLSDRERVKALCGEVRVVREEGLEPLLKRYRRRWGLMLGTMLFALITYLSTQVIWSMEVVGNERISDLAILASLERAGCHVGSFLPDLDLWQVAGDVKRDLGGVSFLAVNIDGTHARVEIMEEERKQIEELSGPPSNLVAERDGQIVRTEVYSGQSVVKVHDVVKKGDLLISGVVHTKKQLYPDSTFRLERSVGAVYARTRREISVTLPAIRTETAEESGEIIEKSLIFFGYRQKVFKKGGNLPPKYGIISEKIQWVLFGSLPLPIWSETVRFAERTEVTLSLTQEELRSEAADALWEKAQTELAQAEMEGYEILEEMSEEGITLTLIAQCVENIGREVPIQILP